MKEHKPNEYAFMTTWEIEAPIEAVWSVLTDFEEWPKWWRGLKSSSKVKVGDNDLYKLTIGYLFYYLTFQYHIDKLIRPHTIVINSTGDLVGEGKYTLSQVNKITTISFTWNVSVTKPWVKVASKFVRPFFHFSHDLVMRWFAEGMARQLKSKLSRIIYK